MSSFPFPIPNVLQEESEELRKCLDNPLKGTPPTIADRMKRIASIGFKEFTKKLIPIFKPVFTIGFTIHQLAMILTGVDPSFIREEMPPYIYDSRIIERYTDYTEYLKIEYDRRIPWETAPQVYKCLNGLWRPDVVKRKRSKNQCAKDLDILAALTVYNSKVLPNHPDKEFKIAKKTIELQNLDPDLVLKNIASFAIKFGYNPKAQRSNMIPKFLDSFQRMDLSVDKKTLIERLRTGYSLLGKDLVAPQIS